MDKKYDLFSYNADNISAINTICDEVLGDFDFNLLTYRRVHLSGSISHLCTHQEWLRRSFEYEYLHSTTSYHRVLKAMREKRKIYHIWNSSPQYTDEVYESMYDADCWNGITIYIPIGESVELWSFSAPRQALAVQSFYLNSIDVLHQFIEYFKYKAYNIINTIETKLLLPTTIDITPNPSDETNLQKFQNKMKNSKFVLEMQGHKIILSNKERQILSCLASGITAKEAAKSFNISHRTVEAHVNKIKNKISDVVGPTNTRYILEAYRENFYE